MRPSFRGQVLCYVTAMVGLLLLSLLLAKLVSPKWVALTEGFIGSLALAVPPARIELAKQSRKRNEELKVGPDLERLKNAISSALDERIETWNRWDTLYIFLGAGLLACSFLVTIVEEVLKG